MKKKKFQKLEIQKIRKLQNLKICFSKNLKSKKMKNIKREIFGEPSTPSSLSFAHLSIYLSFHLSWPGYEKGIESESDSWPREIDGRKGDDAMPGNFIFSFSSFFSAWHG